jgi:integrase
MTRLTSKQIEHLITPGRHRVDDGLYLQVTTPTQRSWLHRYHFAGKARASGLGAFPDVGLAEARRKRDEERAQLRAGRDPIAERKRIRAALAGPRKTFRQAAADYIANHEREWINAKHRNQWNASLATYVFPVIGETSVDAIGIDDVRSILTPLWSSKRETGRRVRQRIEAILDFARAAGWRPQGDNPARWDGNLEYLFPARGPAVEHHAALPYIEVAAFMRELRAQPGVAARALEFLILCAVRTGDLIGQPRRADSPPMRWLHVDLGAGVWTIPHTKSGKELRVPLSDAALAVLVQMLPMRTAADSVVFPGQRDGAALSNSAMLSVLARMGRSDVTAHGFRSTFHDWASEHTEFPNEVIEMALAHKIRGKVERAYRRGDLFDKRRALMVAWADHCNRAPAAVVPLRAAS